MSLASHHGLDTVYRSLQFQNPRKAEELRPDFENIARCGLVEDKSSGKPPVFARMLNSALDELFGRNV